MLSSGVLDMWRYLGMVLLFMVVIAPARGEFFTLSGEDLNWNPQTQPSPQFVVGIGNPNNATNALFAWSLGLEIQRGAGAVGSLEFASASLPPNYLLANRSDGLVPAFAGPSTSILAIGDTDSQFQGIQVPVSGANLLATTFTATPGTRGEFQILVVPSVSPFVNGAYWFSSDFTKPLDFANVPFGGPAIAIGEVTVTSPIPEPQAALLLIGGGLALLVYHRVGSARRLR
jgi:hypothetical protein